MSGVDMLVKFGYCIICDNGPDKINRNWVEDLVKTGDAITEMVKHCSNCGEAPTNKNLLLIEVQITGLDYHE